jgi:hypothetical protein
MDVHLMAGSPCILIGDDEVPPRPALVSGDSGCGKAVIEPRGVTVDLIDRDAAIAAVFQADLPYSANEELDKIAARLRALPAVAPSVTEEQMAKALWLLDSSGCGVYQQQVYMRKARVAIAALALTVTSPDEQAASTTPVHGFERSTQ